MASAWLPAEQFSYIGRPAATFEGRWAAIDAALRERFGDEAFAAIDVGSNHGYFSLMTALRFPASHVLGVEGAVGVGNGVLGTRTRDPQQLVMTEAVATHLTWLEKLQLQNCFVVPEVWDLESISALRAAGFRADVMYTLSVIHHIDGICASTYGERGLGKAEGSLALIAELLCLADAHIVELPDRPWLDHLFDQHGSAESVLRAAAASTREAWSLRRIHENAWLGSRELWLLERPKAANGRDLRRFFPCVLPGAALQLPKLGVPRAAGEPRVPSTFGPPPNAEAAALLQGSWLNSYGSHIEVTGQAPRLSCRYESSKGAEDREIVWERGCWVLSNSSGSFILRGASEQELTWQEKERHWTSRWNR